jgi:oligoendopeptidase F
MKLHTANLSYNAEHLIKRLETLVTQEVTPEWFKEWGDIGSNFNTLYVVTVVCFDSNSNDSEAKERYQKLSRTDRPRFELIWQQLVTKAVDYVTNDPRLQRVIERLKREHEVSSPELLDLERTERDLITTFKSIMSQQVLSEDDTRTLTKARHDLNAVEDDKQRKDLWTTIEKRSMEDFKAIETLFFELLSLRKQQAKQQSLPDYASYIWKSKHRIDYTPEDSLRLLDYVHEYFDDAQRIYKTYKANVLGLSKLRPWNKHVSIHSGVIRTLSESDYLSITQQVFESLSPTFSNVLADMIDKGHIDIMNRPGKTPVNYVMVMTDTDEPVSMMNCTGSPESFRTLFHELGHVIHHTQIGPGKLFFEKNGPKEVNEFFAYSFQILGGQKLVEMDFLSDDEKRSYKLGMIYSILNQFEFIESVERFQHWVYSENATLSIEALNEKYLHYATDPYVDWTGYEMILASRWRNDPIITSPFYSIEYIISWLATLIFINRLSYEPELMQNFKQALTFGNTKTTKETFAALGINFPFTREEIAKARASFDTLFMNFILET